MKRTLRVSVSDSDSNSDWRPLSDQDHPVEEANSQRRSFLIVLYHHVHHHYHDQERPAPEVGGNNEIF